MNHDLSHCEGLNCPRRESCHRYAAHMDLVNNPRKNPRIYYSYVTVDEPAECQIYWEREDNSQSDGTGI